MSEWFVYMICTEKDRLYTGITTNVERRFQEHSGEKPRGAKFFRSDKPQKIVYVEPCKNRSVASKKEAAIKKMTRLQKEKFIKESSHGGNKIYSRRKKPSEHLARSARAPKKGQ